MFDFNKISNFDDHISKSIPSYDLLSKVILHYAEYYLDWACNVYDLGCSTGKHLNMIKKKTGVSYIGIDNSNLIPERNKQINFINKDLHNVELENACLVLSIFTLQFLERKTRDIVINKVSSALSKNGAFIVAEKTYFNDSKVQSITEQIYREFKSYNFAPSEILEKEIQLRENMKPLKEDALKQELSQVGNVELIWKCFNFNCYIVTK